MRKRSSFRVMIDLLILARGELSDLVVAVIAGVVSFLSTVGMATSGAALIVRAAGLTDFSFRKIVYLMLFFTF